MSLELEHLRFRYHSNQPYIVDDLNLTVATGEMLGVTAPSGTGKSTLLRLAALLLPPESGTVSVSQRRVTGSGYAVAADVRRTVGLVLQSPRAATNARLTVRQIIAEPLAAAAGELRVRPDRHLERVNELADTVQLTEDLLDRLPHQLSDGQLQRACLARALALEPRVILCDEPTAMLDAPTTAVIARVIAAQADTGAAVLIASHDQSLLRAVCHRVVVLADGRAAHSDRLKPAGAG